MLESRAELIGATPTLVDGPAGQPLALFELGAQSLVYGIDNMMVLRAPRELIASAIRGLPADGLEPGQVEQVQAYVEALRRPAADQDFDPARPRITQLNVGNTLRCNMRCRYCYNELDGKAVKGSQARDTMSFETSRQMVDAWLAQADGAEALALLFIGGESALDLAGVEQTIAHAQQGCARLDADLYTSLYSNGLAMDRKLLAWAERMDVSLVVSLDGPPAMHDRHRVLADGSGTAAKILQNIELLVRESHQQQRRVRTVTTEPSLLEPLHRYLYDLGFNDLYVQAAYDGEGLGARDEVLDLVGLTRWYGELLLAGVVVGVHPFTAMLERLSRRGAAEGNWYPCTAGVGALGVGPDGHFFLCHHFLDEPGHRLGHVRDGFPDPRVLQGQVRSVVEREPCASCWARHLCGGECYHRAITAGLGHFGVNEAACDTRRAYATAALELFTRVGARRPGALKDLLEGVYHRPVPTAAAYASEDLSLYLA